MIDIITKLKRICNHSNVYLYGAGMYGKILYAYILEQNIGCIDNFIVSESDTQRILFGKNVITLEEYSVQRSVAADQAKRDMIIIAVSEKYSTEVVRQLEDRELHNYVSLTKKEWEVMEGEVLFDWITPRKNIAVLMYHRIIESDYNFWKLNVSPPIFEKHMRFISENYKILRLEEDWKEIVEPNQRYVVITFDDGYVDNYRFALPILEKYHIPATVFVSTNLIDTNEMYWWDELEKIFIVDKYLGEFVFEGISYKITDSDTREEACLTIRNYIKAQNLKKQRASIIKLRSILGTERTETSELRCMNTQELARMAESPYVTIGGHTKSHLSMGDIHSRELLCSEITEGLDILEKKIGKEINVLCA